MAEKTNERESIIEIYPSLAVGDCFNCGDTRLQNELDNCVKCRKFFCDDSCLTSEEESENWYCYPCWDKFIGDKK